MFRTIKPLETSVKDTEFNKEAQYNKQLKEFMRPTLQLKAAKKVKMHRRSIVTHAHAVMLNSEVSGNLDSSASDIDRKNLKPAKKRDNNEINAIHSKTVNVLIV